VDFGTIVALVLWVLAIPITYILGRRNRQRPDLRFATDFDEVLVPDQSLLSGGLTLGFEGASIERLCRTNIAMWNHRGDVIRREDIAEADKLRVRVAEGDSILQIRVVARARAQNELSLSATSSDGTSIPLSFDFLDAGDGVVLEVLHHLPTSATLAGTIKGAKIRNVGPRDLSPTARRELRRSWIARTWSRLRRSFLILPIIASFTGLAGTALTVFVENPTPKLLNPSKFDLSTRQGQEAFASQVTTPIPPFISVMGWTYAGIVLVVLVVAVLFAVRLRRRAIPPSVVAEELQERAPEIDEPDTSEQAPEEVPRVGRVAAELSNGAADHVGTDTDPSQPNLAGSGTRRSSRNVNEEAERALDARPTGNGPPKWISGARDRRPRDNHLLQLGYGDRLRHVDFGNGTVLTVTGTYPKQVAEILFDDNGLKRILVKIAPIEAVW
jgi:hypothetical protein